MTTIPMADYPKLKPWKDRSLSIQYLPTGSDNLVGALRRVLTAVDEGIEPQSPVPIPGAKSSSTINDVCVRLRPAGLVQRRNGTWTVGDDARIWIQSGDDMYLAAVLCSNIRFMSEQLNLMHEPIRERTIWSIAVKEYGMTWKKAEQVHFRNDWFRALGLVQYYPQIYSYELTEAGRTFLSAIGFMTPEEVKREDMAQRPYFAGPTQWGIDCVESAKNNLESRPLSIGHIPGPASDMVTTIAETLSFIMDPRTIKEFDTFTHTTFGASKGASQGFRSSLRRLGLLKDVAEGLEASQPALYWLDESNPVDLVFYLHSVRSYVLEIVQQLKDGPKSRRELAASAHTLYGIDIDRGNLSKRIDFLKNAGMIVGSKVLEATDQGLAALSLADTQPTRSVLKKDDTTGYPSPPQRLSLTNSLQRLRLCARESSQSDAFEKVCSEAFEFLGFKSRWIGKSGNTDVLLTAQCANRFMYRVIVDAKSSGDGCVGDKYVNFDTLEEHRVKHRADYIVVVAERFQGERIKARAIEHSVLLIEVDTLSQIMMMHAEVPLTATDYERLFKSKGLARIDTLGEARSMMLRNGALLHSVMDCLVSQSTDKESGGVLSASTVRFLIKGSYAGPGEPPTEAQVKEMLVLLSSPMIGCVGTAKDGYYAIGSLAEASDRFGYLMKACGARR